jgi:hypothetical protein
MSGTMPALRNEWERYHDDSTDRKIQEMADSGVLQPDFDPRAVLALVVDNKMGNGFVPSGREATVFTPQDDAKALKSQVSTLQAELTQMKDQFAEALQMLKAMNENNTKSTKK